MHDTFSNLLEKTNKSGLCDGDTDSKVRVVVAIQSSGKQS